jgi:chemotaxis protein methyltransferase CheR
VAKRPWRWGRTTKDASTHRVRAGSEHAVRAVIPTGVPDPDAHAAGLSITDAEFHRFRRLVHEQTGIALNDSKRPLLCARLGKRLRRWGYSTFSEYYTHLAERDPRGEELMRMVNAITTNKTDFFREGHHFAILRSHVAAIAARAEGGGPRTLRLWSAGCSSGEEPYSMAVTVLDALPRPGSWDVRILASDIDTDMLATAATGIYAEERVAAVPADLRRRYFVRGRGAQDGFVRVRGDVRDLITFRRINLRDDSWPIRTPLDAIFCRNVIIYFDRELQQRLAARFLELLKPGGVLFLGHSESLVGMRAGLENLGNTAYGKLADQRPAVRTGP